MNKFKRIFEIVKKCFLEIFNKQKIKLIEAPKNIPNDVEENEIAITINNKKEKEDFFIIYENVKKGVIRLDDLMIDDLIKIELMMKNEVDCIDKKINVMEDEIKYMEYQINNIPDANS